ncbi:carbonic anhydrase [Elusimicrobiota bacterium]
MKIFCTAINCIDGRVQIPVIEYLQNRFNADYVDSITHLGPVNILATDEIDDNIKNIFIRIDVSITNHNSCGIAVVSHFDCAGNPQPKDVQIEQVKKSVQLLKKYYQEIEIIGLWVDENWQVIELK